MDCFEVVFRCYFQFCCIYQHPIQNSSPYCYCYRMLFCCEYFAELFIIEKTLKILVRFRRIQTRPYLFCRRRRVLHQCLLLKCGNLHRTYLYTLLLFCMDFLGLNTLLLYPFPSLPKTCAPCENCSVFINVAHMAHSC